MLGLGLLGEGRLGMRRVKGEGAGIPKVKKALEGTVSEDGL